MPIICPVEARSRWVKAVYIVLGIGAVTMVYPMVLMISGSFKSETDITEMDPVPRYFFSKEARYRKFLESKYGGNLTFFEQVHHRSDRSWRQVPMPDGIADAELTRQFEKFRRTNRRTEWQILGHGWGPSGLVFRNTREFRKFLKTRFEGSIERLNRECGTAYVSFLDIVPPNETETASRRYQPAEGGLQRYFDDFKMSRPPEERIFVDLDSYYRVFYIQPTYHTIENYNKLHGTAMKSFDEVRLDERPSGNALSRTDWEYFVRNELGVRFIRIESKGQKPAARDVDLYVQTQAKLDEISVYGPRQAFEDFLRRDSARGRRAGAGVGFVMAVRDADLREFEANTGSVLRENLKRNYLAVLDFVLLHGRGIVNTVIYCVLAVVSQLLVNPLAAYALSRYRPPSTYKILLFCMSTMAFPAAVTMIPTFLLLRNLNLLNTFLALILPSVANGYWIFLLKGFFDSLPRELYEAADIDGASEWRKFQTITMSLSKPILAVIALGAFTAAYSNFMFALIVVPDQRMWTLMVWIYQLQLNSHQAVTYAALCLAAIPTLLVFLLAQNIMMRGLVVPVEK